MSATTPTMQAHTRIRVGCPAHNCGGRCLLIAHVENGRITRLDTDDRPDSLAAPQLRACVRGRAYLRRQYHPDRLLHPLKRVGQRGEGKFERISWDEALDTGRRADAAGQSASTATRPCSCPTARAATTSSTARTPPAA